MHQAGGIYGQHNQSGQGQAVPSPRSPAEQQAAADDPHQERRPHHRRPGHRQQHVAAENSHHAHNGGAPRDPTRAENCEQHRRHDADVQPRDAQNVNGAGFEKRFVGVFINIFALAQQHRGGQAAVIVRNEFLEQSCSILTQRIEPPCWIPRRGRATTRMQSLFFTRSKLSSRWSRANSAKSKSPGLSAGDGAERWPKMRSRSPAWISSCSPSTVTPARPDAVRHSVPSRSATTSTSKRHCGDGGIDRSGSNGGAGTGCGAPTASGLATHRLRRLRGVAAEFIDAEIVSSQIVPSAAAAASATHSGIAPMTWRDAFHNNSQGTIAANDTDHSTANEWDSPGRKYDGANPNANRNQQQQQWLIRFAGAELPALDSNGLAIVALEEATAAVAESMTATGGTSEIASLIPSNRCLGKTKVAKSPARID